MQAGQEAERLNIVCVCRHTSSLVMVTGGAGYDGLRNHGPVEGMLVNEH
jgi:hypothetical protein